MKVFVFVEGEADRKALEALWHDWLLRLRQDRHGIAVVALGDKSRLLRKLGHRAAEKLVANERDLVVGLPDLYPNREYAQTRWKHGNLREVRDIQVREVEQALTQVFGRRHSDVPGLIGRFHPTALKHDMEMLLLAAKNRLRAYLRTADQLGQWRQPVEDQDQITPPKRIVEDLFRTKKGEAYRDTVHAPAVLRNVEDIQEVLCDDNGRPQCPVFQEMIDWIGDRTGIPCRGVP